MQLRQDSWHFQLFFQAYVLDRGWCDAIRGFEGRECPKLPEVESYKVLRSEFYGRDNSLDDVTEDEWEDLDRLNSVASKAVDMWYEQDCLTQSRERAEIVKKRLLFGTMSLCLYFWSVVLALVFYKGFVIPWRGLRRLVSRFSKGSSELATSIGSSVRSTFRLVGKLLILSFLLVAGNFLNAHRAVIGDGIYTVASVMWNSPGVIANEVSTMKTDWQANRDRRRARNEQKLAWEEANPEEVALRAREAEIRAQNAKEIRQQERKRELAQFGSDMLEVGIMAGAIFSVLMACGFVFFVFCKLVKPIVAIFSFFVLGVGWVKRSSWCQSYIGLWRARRERWQVFWTDTKELVWSFVKAKHRGVCPLLPVVDKAGFPITSFDV